MCVLVSSFQRKFLPSASRKALCSPTGVVPLLYSRTPIPDCSPSVSWPDAVLGRLFSLTSVFPSVKWGNHSPDLRRHRIQERRYGSPCLALGR